jgi:hypothetical protein
MSGNNSCNSSIDLNADANLNAMVINLETMNLNLQNNLECNSNNNFDEFQNNSSSPFNNNFQMNNNLFSNTYINNSDNFNNIYNIPFLSKIDQKDDETLPVVSVIVTIYSGSSYDNLFRHVKQKAPEGGRVSLYLADLNKIENLLKVLKNENIEEIETGIKNIVNTFRQEISDLEADCVLFNWECCSGFHTGINYKFPQEKEALNFIKYVLDKGYMTMFSDFALKALINDWDITLLGKNPFINAGECSYNMTLNFIPEVLKTCPSAQLKMVGELCEKGTANVHAISGTIVFTINELNIDPSSYELSILTIATQIDNKGVDKFGNLSTLGNAKGTVGHAMVKFKSGGIMIFSAGHWIELSKLDVNFDNLEKVAGTYGNAYSVEYMNIKNSSKLNDSEKKVQYNMLANQFVQQSAPCNYSYSKINKK